MAAKQDAIEELCAWAKTIEYERLVKHVANAGRPGLRKPDAALRKFLDGKGGSYHLTAALQQVRDDLAGY